MRHGHESYSNGSKTSRRIQNDLRPTNVQICVRRLGRMPPDHPICKGLMLKNPRECKSRTRERPMYRGGIAKKKLRCFINKFPTVATPVFHRAQHFVAFTLEMRPSHGSGDTLRPSNGVSSCG
jgi:hypothetical protein